MHGDTRVCIHDEEKDESKIFFLLNVIILITLSRAMALPYIRKYNEAINMDLVNRAISW